MHFQYIHLMCYELTFHQDIQFLEQLRKNLDSESKMSDIVMLCFVDLLRAASYIPPHQREIPLYNFAIEGIIDFKVGLPKHDSGRQ